MKAQRRKLYNNEDIRLQKRWKTRDGGILKIMSQKSVRNNDEKDPEGS